MCCGDEGTGESCSGPVAYLNIHPQCKVKPLIIRRIFLMWEDKVKTYWIGHICLGWNMNFARSGIWFVLCSSFSLGKYHWNDEACTYFSRTAKSLDNEPIWIFPLPHTWNILGAEKGRWEKRGGVQCVEKCKWMGPPWICFETCTCARSLSPT